MGSGSSQLRRVAHPDCVRIVVVGDVHGAWDSAADVAALRLLDPDLVLFVGDFGDGDVALVEAVSRLKLPKAVILGNHDCFGEGRDKMSELFFKAAAAAERKGSVKQQLEALGDAHIGFGRKDFPLLKLSVVGGRPFSSGGFDPQYCSSLYNVKSIEESADKISSVGMAAPSDHLLVFLGHNGPFGLGDKPRDICGKDFTKQGGDHGDKDLQEAIRRCRASHEVPLVVFGHMHRDGPGQELARKMVVCGDDGTVYVNAAVVPRERQSSTQRNFTVVELVGGTVAKVTETWVQVPSTWGWGRPAIAEEIPLYSSSSSDSSSMKRN